MAARIFIGDGPVPHMYSDMIHDEDKVNHPKVVLVYVWDEKNREYYIKTYAQTHPEEG